MLKTLVNSETDKITKGAATIHAPYAIKKYSDKRNKQISELCEKTNIPINSVLRFVAAGKNIHIMYGPLQTEEDSELILEFAGVKYDPYDDPVKFDVNTRLF